MVLTIYKLDMSPPARAALMTAEALGLDFETVEVHPLQGEHKTPEYTKKNPQQTIPLLQDNDFHIWDSHAIAIYLIEAYGKDDSLYPKDHKIRALINQRLHFDTGILFPRFHAITYSVFYKNETDISQEKYDNIEQAYGWLERFLEHDYLVGDKLTLADISCVATTTTLNDILEINPNKYPKVLSWIERMSKESFFQKWNVEGSNALGNALRNRLKK